MIVKQKKVAPVKPLKPPKPMNHGKPIQTIKLVKPKAPAVKSKPVVKQGPSHKQKPGGRLKPGKKSSTQKPALSATRRYIKKFCIIVGAIVGSFLLLVSVAALGYLKTANEEVSVDSNTPAGSTPVTVSSKTEPEKKDEKEKETGAFLPPRKTNFLIMGLDETEALADVIIAGCFDRETKKIDMISVPRDTYVQLSKVQVKAWHDAGRTPPNVMKMNEVHSYAGKELGAKYQKEVLEGLLGIKFNYYAEVNLDAFKSIVDTVGGVEMTIPDGGLHYSDPTQNPPLYINVPGGLQTLDGKAAEGVVRFRATYRRGDIERIEVQQTFMKQLMKEVLNKDTITKNALSFLSTIIEYVKTDFSLLDAPKYIRYVNDLSADKMTMHTLPGEAQMIGKVSYYIHDPMEISELIDQIFYSTEIEPETSDLKTVETDNATETTEQVTLADVKKLRIQILNGGRTPGVASKKRDELKKDGFNVINVDDYAGTKKDETRIMVKKDYVGKELDRYFKNAVVEKDSNMAAGYDIVIIMGIDG